MNRIQAAQLRRIQTLIWDEKRALAFMQIDLRIVADKSLAELHRTAIPEDLLQAHTDILEAHALYLSTQNPTATPFDPLGVAVNVLLTDDARHVLASVRRLTFKLSPDDGSFPDHMREIFITGFKVAITPPSPAFSGRLIHMGNHRFKTVDGTLVTFSSSPTFLGIQSGQTTDFVDATKLSGGASINGLSAFGDWTISVDPSVSIDLLNGIQSFTVTFMGTSRANTQ